MTSIGNPDLGDSPPYVLAVTSHKGGTGRTTLACGLAWLWGQRGLNVCLVDADPVKAAVLVAAGPDGICPWANVTWSPPRPVGPGCPSGRTS